MMLGRLAWLAGVALLVLVVNVALSILYMWAVCGRLIDPGHEEPSSRTTSRSPHRIAASLLAFH